MKTNIKLLVASSGLAVAAFGASPAFATGTASGSTITNIATVNYTVGTVAQTAITATNAITVDSRIDVIVAENANVTTTVVPGATLQATRFDVTNNSNTAVDIGLSVVQAAGGAATHGGTDTFDATAVTLYRDTNGNGVFDAGTDLAIAGNYLDQVAAAAAPTSTTVFVVVSIPNTRVNGDIAQVTLIGQAQDALTAGTQGANLVATAGANTAGVDVVLADGAGTATGDIAGDGRHSDDDDYTVATASLTVAKLSRVISDPFNAPANAKMIPGAVVEYCITVQNTSTVTPALAVSITDSLPATVVYLASFGIWEGGTVASSVCSGGTNTGTYAAPTVTGNLGTVAASSTKTVYFRATIQ
jgi:hypothetical protein